MDLNSNSDKTDDEEVVFVEQPSSSRTKEVNQRSDIHRHFTLLLEEKKYKCKYCR
jgi:hypothetical protein